MTALIALLLLMLEQTVIIKPWYSILEKINKGILLLFLLDTALRFGLATQKKIYFKESWTDLIAIIPLVQLFLGIRNYDLYVIARLFVIITVLISRTRKIKWFSSSLESGLGS